MRNAWVNPKIIIGNTATGAYYFPRPHIEDSIWEEIEKGNHVLIAAPQFIFVTPFLKAFWKNDNPIYEGN